MTAWTRTTVLEPPSPSCGTAKAARRHLRRQEPLDVPCADALREYQRVQAANSRARARAAVAAAGMLPAA